MNAQTDIGQRIQKIKEIFQQAFAISTNQEDLNLLLSQFENTENTYRSVAYEAAAVAMAIKDFSKSNTLGCWRSFMEGPAALHSAQVHAGLGWAMAQQRISVSPLIESLEPLMRFRMLDGCGYYNGIFRQRQTIMGQLVPQDVEGKFMRGYDQGVGRSLWYISKGDYASIPGMVARFPISRHIDLWRGIGIACAYVGCGDDSILRELFSWSFPFHIQLSVGAALVTRSRSIAKAHTQDMELACQVWCNRSSQQVLWVTEKAEPSFAADPNDAYLIWLSNIEEKLKG
jgi:enediyne biosynthesis protein E3